MELIDLQATRRLISRQIVALLAALKTMIRQRLMVIIQIHSLFGNLHLLINTTFRMSDGICLDVYRFDWNLIRQVTLKLFFN